MNDGIDATRPTVKKSNLGRILAWTFAIALIMGPGPGLMLANRPSSFLGIPTLYFWGLLWYAIEVGVVVIAFLFVWPSDEPAAAE